MAPSRVLSFEGEYDLIVQSNRGLGQLVLDQVLLSPSSLAIIDGESCSLTYIQLHTKALELANQLGAAEYLSEEATGILVNYGAQDIITQLAVIFAGGTCLALDPSLSNSQLRSRLDRAGARHLLVDTHNRGRLAEFFHEIQVDEAENSTGSSVEDGTDVVDTAEDKSSVSSSNEDIVDTSLEHRTHIIYTSGTTSEPKGVQMMGRSILQVAYYAPFIPFDSTDRVAHVNNTSFDVSLFEIWGSLLRGATIVVLPKKSDILDPVTLAVVLETYQITVFITNTAIINLVAVANPSALKRLRLCLFGGEAANVKAIRKILEAGPPQELVNCYGPTETCIMALAHRITKEDIDNDHVSIGGPIGQTQVHILNEDFKPIIEGEVGELFIGGAGVGRGYVNDTVKTAAVFLDVSVLGSGEPVRLYRTGDVVKRGNNGQIYFVGRRDNQVKVRGFRVELEAVETAILNTGRFTEAAALRIESSEEGGGGILVAYVVANSSSSDPLSEIATVLKTSIPEYMVPRFELIKQLPLNAHDKVDRKKLTQLYSASVKANVAAHRENSHDTSTIAHLRKLWVNMLSSSIEDGPDDSDFFQLGGTSLQAAVLIHQIRETFGTEISSLALYSNPKLSDLASVIDESLKNGAIAAIKDERELWIKDSTIADSMLPSGGGVIDWRAPDEGHIFLTGATGFVGSFLLHELLILPEVKQVACLVRAIDSAIGFQRIRQALTRYGLWKEKFYTKILALPGDLVDKTFGLGQDLFEVLAKWSSVTFHLGAHVNFTQPYSVHRPANVVGMVNVLRFVAASRNIAIQYVSSISCFGPTGFFTGATRIREDGDLMPHLAALPYDHGYAQSQWVCEQMLWSAISRGFPVAIYRPGFVTGHSKTGAANPDDFLGRLMDTCLDISCYPLLPDHRSEYVPVDYVVAALIHISSTHKNVGHAYHIVPSEHDATPDIIETFRLLTLHGFTDLQGIPYDKWVEMVTESECGRMKPLLPMLTERVHLGSTRWELYERMPIFETANLDRALADFPGGLKCPRFDGDLLTKYLQHWTIQ